MWYPKTVAAILLLGAALCANNGVASESGSGNAPASDENAAMDEMVVKGSAITEDKAKVSFKAETLAADVQVISKDDVARMNIDTPVDLFRKTPGMRLEDYKQGDIGSAITMRGWSGGGAAGRYVAVYVDGVPQNYITNSGDNLLAWLTPEMIERIEVIKGPFSALYGNVAIGGAINIITKSTDDTPSISASGGSYGGVRVSPTLGKTTWPLSPFITGEYFRKDGYRDNSQSQRGNLFTKISAPLFGQTLSLRFNYYESDWNAPGYLTVDDVRSGVVNRRSTLTPDDGGNGRRYSLVATYTPSKSDKGLSITAYFEDVDLNRYVAFPVTTTSAVNQQLRAFATTSAGGRLLYNYAWKDILAFTAGAEIGYENGSYRRFPTSKRYVTGNATQDWDMDVLKAGEFLQTQVKVTDYLKIVGGLRYDTFNYGITNRTATGNSGDANMGLFSPKIGLVLTPLKDFNIFANKGTGFRAPLVTELSPSSSSQKSNLFLDPAKVDTWDVGFNALLFEKFYLAFDYYWTRLKREIATVNNEPVNMGNSKRNGYEIEAKYYLTPSLTLFGSYSRVEAKLENPATPGQDKVIDVPEEIITGGIEFTSDIGNAGKVAADLYYYYSGGKYYYGTDTTPLKSPAYDNYNLRLSYTLKPFTWFAGATFAPRDASSSTSWLNGSKIMITPEAKWDVNSGIKYEF